MRKVGILVACYDVSTHILSAMLRAADYGIPPSRVFYGTALRAFDVLDKRRLSIEVDYYIPTNY